MIPFLFIIYAKEIIRNASVMLLLKGTPRGYGAYFLDLCRLIMFIMSLFFYRELDMVKLLGAIISVTFLEKRNNGIYFLDLLPPGVVG